MASLEEYSTIPTSDHDHDVQSHDTAYSTLEKSKYPINFSRISCVLISSGLFLMTMLFVVSHIGQLTQYPKLKICDNPIVRREWRSLSRNEKHEYFEAVNCLRSKPSMLGTNHSLYDDFGYSHIQIGNYTHETAGFLPWHRYFIHIYELALKGQCNYTGYLAYWDWELDWSDIETSPIWDNEDGFGGDGTGDLSVGEGRCVTDGPFANMTLFYYEDSEQEHCLSRGFRHGSEKNQFVTSRLHPSSLQKAFNSPDYRGFNLALEDGAHRAIPAFLQGEFGSFTSPNDPIFFLHHTQIDRLWWEWQKVDPERRLRDYGGKAGTIESTREASIDDLLHVGSLGRTIAVSEIMSTETEILCYIY
ncbi:uncharacterized protein EAF02_010274 [Botrytis sinoallii]|uniref:uncharacterized protein n=1 Tax=Botrytis sinoallii TaxID=1463999 RepID=UPI001901C82A|nr:uncharacterized protein EAF02_010274 [Botrytis sinoallii]KAF7864306.1 hypothetical protein EAF02_010274 [Botrytis sinoallii]